MHGIYLGARRERERPHGVTWPRPLCAQPRYACVIRWRSRACLCGAFLRRARCERVRLLRNSTPGSTENSVLGQFRVSWEKPKGRQHCITYVWLHVMSSSI